MGTYWFKAEIVNRFGYKMLRVLWHYIAERVNYIPPEVVIATGITCQGKLFFASPKKISGRCFAVWVSLLKGQGESALCSKAFNKH